MSNAEFIAIKKCPICNGSHKYELKIERSLVIALFTPNFTSSSFNEQKKRFTRLFHCPNGDQDFQATFYLVEDPSSKIKSVEVGKADE